MGKGDSDYVYAFKEIVIPVIKEANPTLVIGTSGLLKWLLASMQLKEI